LGFCQSTSGLDVVSPHCIREFAVGNQDTDVRLSFS
jgi:hypothetical protein